MIVWGNPASGLLFCKGAKFYGLTKRGEFFESTSVIGKLVTARSRINRWRPAAKGGSCLK